MSPRQAARPPQTETDAPSTKIEIAATVVVRDLAELLRSTPIEVIKELMKNGVMAAINQSVDYDAAAAVASSLGFEPHPEGQAEATIEHRKIS